MYPDAKIMQYERIILYDETELKTIKQTKLRHI